MVDYKACCRLCLDPEGNLQSLLQNGIIYEKELQQKILKSLEVEVSSLNILDYYCKISTWNLEV